MTSTIDTVVDESGVPAHPERPRPPVAKWWRLAAGIGVLLAFVWGVSGLDITADQLRRAPGNIWTILELSVPPDFAAVLERGALGKVFESVFIAWTGTVIAAVMSLPLAFLASNNVVPAWIRIPIRQLFIVIRAFPELILATIFLAVVGLGPWAGALAIGFSSIGTLGKWSSESIEEVAGGPVEAIQASGGGWLSGVRWGLLPQVFPTIVAHWLFRFEINVRASAIFGLIGAGGIGGEISSQVQFRNWQNVSAVLIMVVVMVLMIDAASGAVRRRILAGSDRTGTDASLETLEDMGGVLTRRSAPTDADVTSRT
ncbi:MAG TPA: phosphonate ABC transporter, permease protein PhnE [Ilumatobacteraceae bacterium]|nr:phosphonate ABC transporter, permease protein PhnE [Ilumatobacteraceae bacterium]